MSINNIEKQYNKDLDNLKKKIESLKNTLNQYNKISTNSLSCNSDYRIPPVLEDGIYNIVSIPYKKKLHAVDGQPILFGDHEQAKWKFTRIQDDVYNITSVLYPDKKLHVVYCWTGDDSQCRPALFGNTEEAKWKIVKTSDGVYNISSASYPDKKLHVVYCWTGDDSQCRPALFGNTEEAKWNIINLDNNNNASEIMCPKNLPKCLKKGEDDYGMCVTKDNNLMDLENNILLLNNDIINIFTNLNQNFNNYKNNPETLKIYNEIKSLDNSLSTEINKEIIVQEEQNNIKNFKDTANIRKSENTYYNYLLLVVILLSYSVYSLYRGENYDNIDYIILFLILLYIAYVAYMTFYK